MVTKKITTQLSLLWRATKSMNKKKETAQSPEETSFLLLGRRSEEEETHTVKTDSNPDAFVKTAALKSN